MAPVRPPLSPEPIEKETYAEHVPGVGEFVALQGKHSRCMYYTPKFFYDPVAHADIRLASREHARTKFVWNGALERTDPAQEYIGEGSVLFPSDPAPSAREIQSLHNEILYYVQYRDVTYKDAAYQLYMAELAALRAHSEALVEMTAIKDEIDAIMESDLCAPIRMIDEGIPEALNPLPGEVLEIKVNESKEKET